MGLRHIDTSHQKELGYQNTWRHLAPKKNTTYKGNIVISKSCFYSSDISIVDFKFNNLESSPWLFEALEDYFFKTGDSYECGKCYKINITFRNYRIWTKTIETF